MKIAAVDTVRFEPRFSGGGYAMSRAVQTALFDRLVRVTFADGTASIGECIRAPLCDPQAAQALEDEALADLPGSALGDLPQRVSALRTRDAHLIGLAAALDTVFHDVVARRAGLPISVLLGGPRSGHVPEVLSLSCAAPEVMAEAVRAGGRQHGVIQIKLGRGNAPDQDLARVRAVLSAMGPGQRVLADFNGALEVDTARRTLPQIRDSRLIWEEPCRTYEGNCAVARDLDGPVLFDQCLTSPELCVRAVRDGHAAGMVIKPAGLGGLAVTRQVRDLCASAGLMMRIDGPWCGQIGAAAALHLALGAPEAQLYGSIDLTEALETPRTLIARPAPARIGPVPGPGLGAAAPFDEVIAA